ncbi:unnamed protein product [Schistocephalus solidus]|uniref:Reverse transcriptase domain-containing protein n=1 Tax=Schistocephalus solidus TaxID=70667 RepID=A0A183SWQ5_SCHSO|nr:unnamed protein product [Schistocephalus solidus]
MIKAYYSSPTARVLVLKNLSHPFDIRSGVQQGGIPSPILFNYAIDWIIEKALHEEKGVALASGRRLTALAYTDGIALLAKSFGDLQSMVSWANEVTVNPGKTKMFSSSIPYQEKAPFENDSSQLEKLGSFKYLGARLLRMDGVKTKLSPKPMLLVEFSKALENAYGSDVIFPSLRRFTCIVHPFNFLLSENSLDAVILIPEI